MLAPGQLVYARVVGVAGAANNNNMDPELECAAAATGRADGLGPLAGGMAVAVSLGFARRLLMPPVLVEGPPSSSAAGKGNKARGGAGVGGVGGGGRSGVVVLDELGAAGLAFETAVGRNGRVWVGGEAVKTVVVVCRAIQETDEKKLGVEAQRKLVRRLLKEAT